MKRKAYFWQMGRILPLAKNNEKATNKPLYQ
jgi:hypothetical protein